MEVLKKFKTSSYAVSIIYIIVGLIMLLNPSFISDAVNYVIGILVIIYGVIYSISLYQKREIEMYGKFDFLAGIICISFGLFLILNPDTLGSLIPFCAGVIILMDAIRFIINSIRLKKLNYKSWIINLIVGLIFLGFAIAIIVKAKEISYLLIRFIGAFLIVDALLDFFTELRFRKCEKKIEKYEVIEAQIEE
jgi:uncharacterized membrane protein HdeD (DUF308 family)